MKIIKKLSILILFLSTVTISSQETHYWFHNFGATSSLKGGIEVAGSKNVARLRVTMSDCGAT